MKYIIKTTDELQLNDVVFCHGSRFRITAIFCSMFHWMSNPASTGNATGVRYPVLVCKTECLEPAKFQGPKSWALDWTIQGNRLASWGVQG